MTVEVVKPMPDDHVDLADMERRIKAIFIGSVGNLVEWYDFYAYTAFALYFAPAFFPNSDPVVQQLNAALLFAATFLMRPLCGWLFRYIADRYGRRLSLTLSVVCMCFGSLIIAVTPTYASIGLAAPVILALARIIEGLSLGGEYGASATYLSEVADARHRGFYSSFQYVTLIGGQLTALIVLLLLQKVFLTPEGLNDWGWRIPFVIGAGLAIFAAVMPRKLHEAEAVEEARKIAKPTGSINPSTLRSALIDTWDKYCADGITRLAKVSLSAELMALIEGYDFSNVDHLSTTQIVKAPAAPPPLVQ